MGPLPLVLSCWYLHLTVARRSIISYAEPIAAAAAPGENPAKIAADKIAIARHHVRPIVFADYFGGPIVSCDYDIPA